MGLHLVTGHKGSAHITPTDVGAFNAGVFGNGEYILNVGEKFKIEVESNNLVRIFDGDLMMQGRHISLKRNSTEELTIDNGSNDMNRNDLIVVRYTHEVQTGVENAELAVIKGEERSGTAIDPDYTTGDILSGDCTLHEMPLYRIPITGLNVGTPEMLAREFQGFNGTLSFKEWNPLKSIDEDTPQKWKELGTGIFMIDQPDRIIGQPSQWGLLYNTVCAEEIAQKFVVQASGETFRRNANGIGWYGTNWRDGTWIPVYDKASNVIVQNTYIGNGATENFINLGFTPSWVFVTNSDGYSCIYLETDRQNYFYGGLAVKGHNTNTVSIVENGFKVFLNGKYKSNLNGSTYMYLAGQ